jgi:hypothetical protein
VKSALQTRSLNLRVPLEQGLLKKNSRVPNNAAEMRNEGIDLRVHAALEELSPGYTFASFQSPSTYPYSLFLFLIKTARNDAQYVDHWKKVK